MQSHLKSSAGIAVGSSESRVTEAALIQTVPMPPTMAVTGWPNVEVLHSPLDIRVLLVKPEPHSPKTQTAEMRLKYSFFFQPRVSNVSSRVSQAVG